MLLQIRKKTSLGGCFPPSSPLPLGFNIGAATALVRNALTNSGSY
jgi:hypothetical protein